MTDAALGTSPSLCPECFATIPCRYEARNDDVWQAKTCREHGDFEAVAWRASTTWSGPDPSTTAAAKALATLPVMTTAVLHASTGLCQGAASPFGGRSESSSSRPHTRWAVPHRMDSL